MTTLTDLYPGRVASLSLMMIYNGFTVSMPREARYRAALS